MIIYIPVPPRDLSSWFDFLGSGKKENITMIIRLLDEQLKLKDI